jgi:glucose-6-phosphate dehydrogenase assembly protein OpcA
LSAQAKSTPEVAWRGEAVTIGDVLGALGAMRRKFAQAEAGELEQSHPRGCVMTLVAIAASAADERRAQRACMAIAANHPSLAIVVREEPNVRSGRIDASITTHTIAPSSADHAQCELITLHVQGAAGEHLAALLDPLLLGGVPTNLWWLDTPPFGTKELTEALRIGDALVVDSARFDRPYHSFLGLAELGLSSDRRPVVADFQWARLGPWREIIAQFFEPKERRGFMAGIAELGIDYVGDGRGNRIAAALLIGWFASALGWTVERAVGGSGGIVVAHFAERGGRALEVAFRSVPRAHLASGEISAVRIGGASGGSTFRLTVQRDPQRQHRLTSEVGPSELRLQHHPGGEDDAGWEVAQRAAAQHRDMLERNRQALHHTATGELPGEPAPSSSVLARERRLDDSNVVLLTMIDIGGAQTLRHVQRVPAEDEATLLLELLSIGSNDAVYARSLASAAGLMRALSSRE